MSGYTPQGSVEILDDLARRGLVFAASRGAFKYYHQVPWAVGFTEYAIPREWDPEYVSHEYNDYLMANTNPGLLQAGTPLYFAIPCDEKIVAEERIIPCQDYREIVDRFDTIAVLPCHCSLHSETYKGRTVPPSPSEEVKDYILEDCGHHIERCMVFGEQAEFDLNLGFGRKVDKEEALALLQRSVDEGLVLQSSYCRDTQIICCCHSDCCGTLGCYRNLEPLENWENSQIKFNCSSYLLNYDTDACIKCYQCVERCPMRAIEIGEDGYPVNGTYCVRCGQCAYICPASARNLTERPAEDRMDPPQSELDDWNMKFGYRLEHGLI